MNEQQAIGVLLQVAQSALANGLIKDFNTNDQLMQAVKIFSFKPGQPIPKVEGPVGEKVQEKPKVSGSNLTPKKPVRK